MAGSSASVKWSQLGLTCARPGCPNGVTQAGRGRERAYCSGTCRSQAHKDRERLALAIRAAARLRTLNEDQLVGVLAALPASALTVLAPDS